MATYTMELRKVCEYYGRDEVEQWFKSYKLEDFLTPEQINTLNKFSVWSKDRLASKIVDHYFMREIGFETPYLFRHYAITTMNEIMEKYLLMIYTKFLEYDPLSSVDYVETYKREINSESQNQGETSGTSNSESNSNANGLNIENDTPQTNITKQNLENGLYASNVSQSDTESNIVDETTSSTESQNSGTSKTIETYTHSMKGDNGVIVTNQYLVREFRELCNNFDLEIINELQTLFMGLY